MKKNAAVMLFSILLITGCAQNNKKSEASVMLSWQNIVPGKTTETEVITLLGEPDETGSIDNQYYLDYYNSYLNPFHSNRIYFRERLFRDKVVSWIDVEMGVEQDSPFTIGMAMEEYGQIVDSAAARRFGDVEQPEIIYVWSNYGVAFSALTEQQLEIKLSREVKEQCEQMNPVQQTYIRNDLVMQRDYSNACDIVVRMVMFSPTKFSRFWDEYGYKIRRLTFPLSEYVH